MRTSSPFILSSLALLVALAGCTKAESEAPKARPAEQPLEQIEQVPAHQPEPGALEPATPPSTDTAALAPPPVAPAPQAAAAPDATGCSFVDPQFFGMLPAKWEGPCQDGKAHGRGILRSYEGKKVAATFFGTMEQGNPKLGVVEDRDGLLIGRFAPGGTPIQSDEFKDRLDGVNEAVAAAKQAADKYQREGNATSAALYTKKAKMLDKQIE